MCYIDPYELVIRTVCYCIFVLVEILDKGIPFVCDVQQKSSLWAMTNMGFSFIQL